MVFSLFRTGTKEWDMEVLNDIFVDRDKQCILNTRVEQDLNEDILCWKLENSGQYSVESAYKLIQNQKGAWNAASDSTFWKRVWNIRAPPKALSLVWRAVSNCLPTKSVLQTKHVTVENTCPVCNEEIETIFHSLVQCRAAALCWKVHNAEIPTNVTMDFSVWLERNLSAKSVQNNARIVTLCWSIWRARNDLVWNNKRWNPMRIVAKAWEYLTQWTVAHNRFFVAPLQPSMAGDGATYWIKPQYNEVKITADAAIVEDHGASSIGLIVRDHEGHLLLACTRCFRDIMNPTLVEAIAIKEALSWAKEWPNNTVTIESDCLVVVQMIRSNTPNAIQAWSGGDEVSSFAW